MSALERRLAIAHGAFNVLNGIWPLANLRSFEWVFGPKTDRWLVRTVAGLLAAIGWAQLVAAGERDGSGGALRVARRVGVGSAGTLLTIDLVYVPRGRIRATYLLDAVCELAWLVAWGRTWVSGRGDRETGHAPRHHVPGADALGDRLRSDQLGPDRLCSDRSARLRSALGRAGGRRGW